MKYTYFITGLLFGVIMPILLALLMGILAWTSIPTENIGQAYFISQLIITVIPVILFYKTSKYLFYGGLAGMIVVTVLFLSGKFF